ncbi:MAG: hypothetical protein ABIO04_05560 [Ferruginibacter sp.]
MPKVFFIIILTIVARSSFAQDPRFEYKDSTLLMETSPGSIDDPGNPGAIETDTDKDILSDTTLYFSGRNISPDTVRKWKSDPRFAYITNLDSLLKVKQQEALSKQETSRVDRSTTSIFSSPVIEAILWTVAIGFVLFILYRLFLSEGLFRKSSTTSKVKLVDTPGNSAGLSKDFDSLLHQSVKLGDYRMAVRYLFLKTIAQLSEKDYLQQSADKTNYQYVQEIEQGKKNDFASLVVSYEYIWYGKFPISSDSFKAIEQNFREFYNKI